MRRFLGLLLGCGAQSRLTFEPPRLVDDDVMPTDFMAFDAGAVLGREFNLLSNDPEDGMWAPSSPSKLSSVIHYFPRQCDACKSVWTVGGVLNASHTNQGKQNLSATKKSRRIYLNSSMQQVETSTAAPSMHFEGLPRPSKCWQGLGCMRMGGTTSVAVPAAAGGGFLLTGLVQWGGMPSSTCDLSSPTRTCNQTSIVVFRSVNMDKPDTLQRWRFLSVLANAADYPQSLEGPNEHDMTLLADKKTLLAVVRMDGGDGGLKPPLQPYHYLNYHMTTSTDFGRTWSPLLPIDAGCARPRLLLVGGTLLLSGGRFRTYANTSDVLVWESPDGKGQSWRPYSISYYHNLLADTEGHRSSTVRDKIPLFDAMVNFSGPVFTEPRETNAYTSLVKINETAALVFYDQKFKSKQQRGRREKGKGSSRLSLTSHSFSMVFRIVPQN